MQQALQAGNYTTDTPPKLVPYAHAIYHNRNRTYALGLGRFMQSDPNATGIAALETIAFHGTAISPAAMGMSLETLHLDGANLFQYIRGNPLIGSDPLGLFVPGPSDFISGALEALVTEYSDRLSYDVDWATNWEAEDQWHSRLDNRWVTVALGRGLHSAFDFFGYNPLGEYDGLAVAGAVPGGRFPNWIRNAFKGKGPIHHIATIYGANGARFQVLFKKIGVELNDAANALPMPGHKGPHAQRYHDEVYQRLKSATNGLTGPAARQAFYREMMNIRRDIISGTLSLD